jgi:hypothetical protein
MVVTPSHTPAWLCLVFRLPSSRGSQRVEIWRKLQRYGSLPMPGSGHLLPKTAQNQERFEWLASAIRSYKGEASVLDVNAIEGMPDKQIVQQFTAERAKQYAELEREIRKAPKSNSSLAQKGRWRRRFEQITDIDFFHSPVRVRVEELLLSADGLTEPRQLSSSDKNMKTKYMNRTWLTRPRPGIDRVSSAWLIRKFIDQKAKFQFSNKAEEYPEAIPFDMFHAGGFGHQGQDCTFETLCKEFKIKDKKVRVIAEMVHDADLDDEKFGRTEALGLQRALRGWEKRGHSDSELLDKGMELIDGLYNSF